MIDPFWLTLPLSWEASIVRAVFPVIINVICAVTVWVAAYATWKAAALQASKQDTTKLLSFVSMSGVGDALDGLFLLHPSLGRPAIIRLLFQSGIVILFSVVSGLSGIIARFATSQGKTIRQHTVSGWLATTNHKSMGGALVKWNTTIERLNSAGFPYNQLLDFLPNNSINWKYYESEWNSSWTADCHWTDRTPLNLTATGNYTGDVLDEVPGMAHVFPPATIGTGYATPAAFDVMGTYEDNRTYTDQMVFVVLQTDPKSAYARDENNYANWQTMEINIASFWMHQVPQEPKNLPPGVDAIWGTGPIENSSYTMARCVIGRAPGRTRTDRPRADQDHIAFPWTTDRKALPQAMSSFFMAELVEQSFNHRTIYQPSGPDLFRFYQAYFACKDTQYQQTVARPISVELPTVELAVPALVPLVLCVAVVLATAVWFGLVRRLPGDISIPRTKVEWMMQALREVGGRDVNRDMFEMPLKQLKDRLRRADFGQAYGERGGLRNSILLGPGHVPELSVERIIGSSKSQSEAPDSPIKEE